MTQPLPSLNNVFAMLQKEETCKKVMLGTDAKPIELPTAQAFTTEYEQKEPTTLQIKVKTNKKEVTFSVLSTRKMGIPERDAGHCMVDQ